MTGKKKNGLSNELKRLRVQKNHAAKLCALGVAAVLLVTVVRQVLGFSGVVPFGYTMADTIMFVLCLAVCFVMGPQFSLYLRLKRQIQDMEIKLEK